MISINNTINNTINHVRHLIIQVDNLISKIRKYIYDNDITLNDVKDDFAKNFKEFKQDFLNKFNYMQSQIHNHSYSFDNLQKTDDIIDIMLLYDVVPRDGIFTWGWHTVHLKSLELAFIHNVLPRGHVNFRNYYLNNAMLHIIHSARPACQIINAIDIFIKYGYNFNDYYLNNFLISWNLPVFKYILSVITRPIDYMKELLSAIKQMSKSSAKDTFNVKNVITYIVDIVTSNNTINRQDNIGCTDLHYICSDYTSLHAIDLDKAPYYEYLIEAMLLNGADITIQDNSNLTPIQISPKAHRIIDKKLETKLHAKLITLVKDIFLDRAEAIEFVEKVSWYLLPDIADVVFGHRCKFDTSIHYDLAKAVCEK